jgi:hypothetical protein
MVILTVVIWIFVTRAIYAGIKEWKQLKNFPHLIRARLTPHAMVTWWLFLTHVRCTHPAYLSGPPHTSPLVPCRHTLLVRRLTSTFAAAAAAARLLSTAASAASSGSGAQRHGGHLCYHGRLLPVLRLTRHVEAHRTAVGVQEGWQR